MNPFFVHQRIDRAGLLKCKERRFGRRNQADLAVAVPAPGADKMPPLSDDIDLAGFDQDFCAGFSHNRLPLRPICPIFGLSLERTRPRFFSVA